ncbi:MAG: metallophosphoesterase family protein, partial [Candidatus Omnitrophota bacterium]
MKRICRSAVSVATICAFFFNYYVTAFALEGLSKQKETLRALALAESGRSVGFAQPISDPSFNATSVGSIARPQPVMHISMGDLSRHVHALGERVKHPQPGDNVAEAARIYHRTLRLIGAAVDPSNTAMLEGRGPLTLAEQELVIRRCGQFTRDGFDEDSLRARVAAVGRADDFAAALEGLRQLTLISTQEMPAVTVRARPQAAASIAGNIGLGELSRHLHLLEQRMLYPEPGTNPNDAARVFHRTLRLIGAAVDPASQALLEGRGNLSPAEQHRILQQCGRFVREGFNHDALLARVRAVGREDDFTLALEGLWQLTRTATPGSIAARHAERAPVRASVSRALNIRLDDLGQYLIGLQDRIAHPRPGDSTAETVRLYHRTLRLIGAALDPASPALLEGRGPLDEEAQKAIIRQLGEFAQQGFDHNALLARVRAVDREDDFTLALQGLWQLTQTATQELRATRPAAEPSSASARAASAVPLEIGDLARHLQELAERMLHPGPADNAVEAGRLFHRTLRLIGAALDPTSNILLEGRGPLSAAEQQAIVGQCAQFAQQGFNHDALLARVRAVDREDDFTLALQGLWQLTPAATGSPAVRTRGGAGVREAARPRVFERPLLPVLEITEEAARARIAQLEALRDGIRAGKFKRQAMFGDQHGQHEVFERMLEQINAGNVDAVIGHGDVFDRGVNNAENWAAMQEIKDRLGDNAAFCFGNHDVMMIQGLLLNDHQAMGMWIQNGGGQLWQEFEEKGLQPRDLALWLLKNCKLFDVDERGVLHLHAGIPIGNDGNPVFSLAQMQGLQDELVAIQAQLSSDAAFLDKRQNVARVAKLFKAAHELVWVRRENWINKFVKEIHIDVANKEKLVEVLRAQGKGPRQIDECWRDVLLRHGSQLGIDFQVELDVAKIDKFCAQMGVNGIVFGHEWQDRLMNFDNRIFCLDVHQGQNNGFMIANGNGLRFNAVADSQERMEVTNEEQLLDINNQICRLKEALGESSAPEAAEAQSMSASVAASHVNAQQALEARQEAAVSANKDHMNFLKQAMILDWGKGTCQVRVRLSTTDPSVVRVDNMRLFGQTIAAIFGFDAHGQPVRLPGAITLHEGERVRIGNYYSADTQQHLFRDATGRGFTYCLVVGDVAYRIAPLPQRDGTVLMGLVRTTYNEASFEENRTISNNPHVVTVQARTGQAVSRTSLRAVTVLRAGREAEDRAELLRNLGMMDAALAAAEAAISTDAVESIHT